MPIKTINHYSLAKMAKMKKDGKGQVLVKIETHPLQEGGLLPNLCQS